MKWTNLFSRVHGALFRIFLRLKLVSIALFFIYGIPLPIEDDWDPLFTKPLNYPIYVYIYKFYCYTFVHLILIALWKAMTLIERPNYCVTQRENNRMSCEHSTMLRVIHTFWIIYQAQPYFIYKLFSYSWIFYALFVLSVTYLSHSKLCLKDFDSIKREIDTKHVDTCMNKKKKNCDAKKQKRHRQWQRQRQRPPMKPAKVLWRKGWSHQICCFYVVKYVSLRSLPYYAVIITMRLTNCDKRSRIWFYFVSSTSVLVFQKFIEKSCNFLLWDIIFAPAHIKWFI